ncbi:MAG: hypothetical protein QGH24_03775 [Candidatus Marinimicrobia bacterium]|nr:hypothetical protein [Candidatus Neomarinimicrobiota bacterium]
MTKQIIICFSILFSGCTQELKNKNIPSTPVWVEKSRPEDLDERGIDAHNMNLISPDKNSIKLAWHPNPEEDIWKYHLYRTDVVDEENFPTDFSIILTTEIDTLFYDEEVFRYVEFYYYLIAENFDGIKSATSDTISYKLLKKPSAFTTSDSIQSISLQFHWLDHQYGSHIPSYYAVKIENEFGHGVWGCLFLNPNFLNNGEPVSFSFSLNGTDCVEYEGIDDYLEPGRYFWKIKALRLGNGIATSADHDIASAESNWVEINIID